MDVKVHAAVHVRKIVLQDVAIYVHPRAQVDAKNPVQITAHLAVENRVKGNAGFPVEHNAQIHVVEVVLIVAAEPQTRF